LKILQQRAVNLISESERLESIIEACSQLGLQPLKQRHKTKSSHENFAGRRTTPNIGNGILIFNVVHKRSPTYV